MIKGLYSAVSAMLMNSNRQQILSHNVANMDTPGFKEVMATVEKFQTTTAIDPMSVLNSTGSTRVVGMLGLGVQSGADENDFSQGSLQKTDNPYDLAIQGTAFFHVKTPDGDRYTRDGRFIKDASGKLVTTEGYQVLGKGGQPIQLADGKVEFSSTGEIYIDGTPSGQLDLAEFDDLSKSLKHDQGNMFTASGSPKAASSSSVVQGALESSNVNAAQIMAQMIEVSRAYEAAQQMVQNQDELLGKTISSLGRIR